MLIHILRHGATQGNTEGRYIGSTDEPLSEQGAAVLQARKDEGLYPNCRQVYTSPMLRCAQTADILYPEQPRVIVPDLAEYHFGIFEGKNYDELNGTLDYQAFIDSDGKSPIPGAPDLGEYRAKCEVAFEGICANADGDDIAIICHGGAIMAILQSVRPRADIYDYRVKNGEGYTIEWARNHKEYGVVTPIGKDN